jgi:hypothetical protein
VYKCRCRYLPEGKISAIQFRVNFRGQPLDQALEMTRTKKVFCALFLLGALFPYRPAASRFFASGTIAPRTLRQTQTANSDRVRIAEGEYKIYRHAGDSGIGPFDPAIHDFAEAWTLWRMPDGSLEVEGNRTYEAPQYEPHKDAFRVRLTSHFTVSQITEYKKLRWRPDSGPLSCDFLPNALDCNSGARDPKQQVRLHLQLSSPYGFLWPISAFSVSNITRFVERKAGSAIPVSMLMINEPGPDDPVMASVVEGKLRYLGREQTTISDKMWLADRFELQVALNPAIMIWTSPQGLLLDMTLEDNKRRLTEHGLKLASYKQYADF